MQGYFSPFNVNVTTFIMEKFEIWCQVEIDWIPNPAIYRLCDLG